MNGSIYQLILKSVSVLVVPIRTSMDNSTTKQYMKDLRSLIYQSNHLVRDLEPTNSMQFLRVGFEKEVATSSNGSSPLVRHSYISIIWNSLRAIKSIFVHDFICFSDPSEGRKKMIKKTEFMISSCECSYYYLILPIQNLFTKIHFQAIIFGA